MQLPTTKNSFVVSAEMNGSFSRQLPLPVEEYNAGHNDDVPVVIEAGLFFGGRLYAGAMPYAHLSIFKVAYTYRSKSVCSPLFGGRAYIPTKFIF